MAYIELLQRLALETGSAVSLYGRGGCPQVSLQKWRGAGAGCADFDPRVFADIARRAQPGMPWCWCRCACHAFPISSCCSMRSAAGGRTDGRGRGRTRRRSGRGGRAVETPGRRGVRIVLEAPKPVLPAPSLSLLGPLQCPQRGLPQRLDSTRVAMETLRAPMLGSLQQVVDGLQVACCGTRCRCCATTRYVQPSAMGGRCSSMAIISVRMATGCCWPSLQQVLLQR